jgi:hypothetical protein
MGGASESWVEAGRSAAPDGGPGDLIVFDLRTLVRFQEAAPSIQVLSDIGTARVVLLALRAGQELPGQRTTDQVLAQPLRGEIVFRSAGSQVVARAGTLLQLEARVAYSIVARTNVVALLILTPGPGEPGLDRAAFAGLSPLVARAPAPGESG